MEPGNIDSRDCQFTYMQEDHKIRPLIDKYLAGQAAPEEEKALNEWFEQLHTPPAEGETGEYPSRDDLFAGIHARIQAYEQQQGAKVVTMKPRSINWRLAASVISAVVMLGSGWLYKSRFQPRKVSVKLLDLYTQTGQLTKITLTDSSVVWLNANSHLRYPEAFQDTRTVYLEGEAYFDVHQDPQRPFIIESDGYRTRVLGTTFGIRSYTTPNIYKVTVSSGKVAVSQATDTTHPVMLVANQEIRFNGEEGTREVRNVRAASLMRWTEGGLSFEKDVLAEVVVSLEHRYGTKFQITASSLKRMEISGTFDHHQSLDDIIKILGKVYGLHFRKQSNGIINIS